MSDGREDYMSHQDRIAREKLRVTISFSMREIEALIPAVAIGKMDIESAELYSGRKALALERAISKLHDAETRLRKKLP